LASTISFALFAAYLCAFQQDMKHGNDVGNLALLLLKKYPSKEAVLSTSIPIYSLVKCWNEHIQSLTKPILHAFKSALETGDHEKLQICANSYFITIFVSGLTLTSVERIIDEMEEIQFINKIIPNTIGQITSTFIFSESRNPSVLIKEKIQELPRSHIPIRMLSRVYILCLMAATYFHEYEVASGLIEGNRLLVNLFGTYLSVLNEFFVGFVALSVAKMNTEKSKWLSIAKSCIDKLRNWCPNVPENISNKLTLLEAEMSASNGDDDNAKKLYIKAISLSKKFNFIHEEALACEKAGKYFLEKNDEVNAAQLLLRSYKAYFQWGATAKMYHLRSLYPAQVAHFNSLHSFISSTTGIPLDISLRPSSALVSGVSEVCGDRSITNCNRAKKKARVSLD